MMAQVRARRTSACKKVAILKDVKSDYSVGLAQYFTDAFTAAGGTIVAEQAYQAGDQDFSAQLTAIKAEARRDLHPRLLHRGRPHRPQGARAGHHGAAAGRRRLGEREAARDRRRGAERLLLLEPLGARQARPEPAGLPRRLTARSSKSDPDAIGGLAYDAANVLFALHGEAGGRRPDDVRGARLVEGRHARAQGGAREAARPDRRDEGLRGRHRRRSRSTRTATPQAARW